MKEITVKFGYCCSYRFNKVYGKLIRSVKKQYKKIYNDIELDFKDLNSTKVSKESSNEITKYCCKKCLAMIKKNYNQNILVTTSEIKIKIPKGIQL